MLCLGLAWKTNISIIVDVYAHVFPGARRTKHISIEFEIRWKFRML